MNDNDDAMANIYKKIEREKALINAANSMRQQTNNDDVRSRLDSQMREGRRNIQFFEEKLRDLQMKRLGQGVDSMSIGPASPSSSSARPTSGDMRSDTAEGAPALPPKDTGGFSGDRGSYGSLPYSQIGGHGDLMPPRHPFPPPGPTSSAPKMRPNFTKLGLSHLSSLATSAYFSLACYGTGVDTTITTITTKHHYCYGSRIQ